MEKQYDEHGTASHYDDQRINVIHQMEAIWGTLPTMVFCEMNAFKYRMRLGKKDDPSLELTKIKWYETMAKHLRDKPEIIRGLSMHHSHPLDEKFLNKLNK